jgi:hypothetical protein
MIIFARSFSATTQKWLMDNVQADTGGGLVDNVKADKGG